MYEKKKTKYDQNFAAIGNYYYRYRVLVTING